MKIVKGVYLLKENRFIVSSPKENEYIYFDPNNRDAEHISEQYAETLIRSGLKKKLEGEEAEEFLHEVNIYVNMADAIYCIFLEMGMEDGDKTADLAARVTMSAMAKGKMIYEALKEGGVEKVKEKLEELQDKHVKANFN